MASSLGNTTHVPINAPSLTPEIEEKLLKYPKEDVFDGCTAAAHVAYACTDTAFIYPITPSTPMAEIYDEWSSSQKRVNVFGQVPSVTQMQSEAGAAGAVHGALSTGALTTTFTASQGLLLMIPPMYKIAGEQLPCVFHVAARAVAGQALSIFGDHSDVMACRQAGWAMLSSSSVQEAQDLGVIAHMATLEARVPFIHFCDGFRTSHELRKIKVLDYQTIRKLINYDSVSRFRASGLNPTHPYLKGTAQGPEVYFQNVETANKNYNECTTHIIRAMEKFGNVTGRRYELFEYHGSPQAKLVVVIMGSGSSVVKEAIDWMLQNGHADVGCLTVKAFRPWNTSYFLRKLPQSCERICVLDRVKEPGALGEPMFLDVSATLKSFEHGSHIKVVGGRYGLGSRDFTPPMVIAVFDNLKSFEPRHGFTVGIHDDVTMTSLDYSMYTHLDCVPAGTTQCMFWGMGSDGTVGANKNVIKILGQNTPLNTQGYFAYSAHKAGGLTVSHLRFGPKQFESPYLLQASDYIAIHRHAYLNQYPCLKTIKRQGTVAINCPWSDAEIETHLPGQVKQRIARNGAKLYVIDADKVAVENGMGRRINNVLMTVFFKVSGVLPFEEAIALFKQAIKKTYQKKGMHIVEANWKCVDAAVDATREVKYDTEMWANAEIQHKQKVPPPMKKLAEPPSFIANVMYPLQHGEDLPVSAFLEGGILPPGTTGYEKRAIALNIPIVDMDKCTQCNQCAFVCPHAAIRPFLLDDEEAEIAPKDFIMRKCKAPASVAQYKFRIQVAPYDCTGCELCFMACPDQALTMKPLATVEHAQNTNWQFAMAKVSEKSDDVDEEYRGTLKGSQFYTPMVEFSGACEGCGETPYAKLLTQLFGERVILANATGCSSIWSASYPANAWTTNEKGYGTAWGNSLFEDNAEYGFGMAKAVAARRQRLHEMVGRLLADADLMSKLSSDLKSGLTEWHLHWKDAKVCQKMYEKCRGPLTNERHASQLVADIDNSKDLLPKISQWIMGGDGWAYDIGFGGLDHVVASGIDVNILVLDTEVYSNTGGQASKATPIGAVHKFAAGGKLRSKKDLGAICMEYGDIYVASISSSANMSQTVRAFVEAESYPGCSVIMAYAPCIEHNYIKPFNQQIEHCKLAVNAGFWPLYRYDPRLIHEGKSPFQLDSKKIRADIGELLRKENRFAALRRANPALADNLEDRMREWASNRFDNYLRKAQGVKAVKDDEIAPESLYTVLYGTDTGTAEQVAGRVVAAMQDRGMHARSVSMDEMSLEDLSACVSVVVVCSTTGQGEFPPNAKALWAELSACQDFTVLSKVNYAVMGLGDSAYVFFNQAAKRFDERFSTLGAKRVAPLGLGDDQAEDGFDTVFTEWLPHYLQEVKAPAVVNVDDGPISSMFNVAEIEQGDNKYEKLTHDGFQIIQMVENRRITPPDYEVDVRHLEFDLLRTNIKYALGDSLAWMPWNLDSSVEAFCEYFNLNPNQWIKVEGKDENQIPRKYAALFGKPITIRTLLAECLDICGKPPRNFYENIYRYATDPAEKEELKHVLDKENKDKLKGWIQHEKVNYFDIFKKFPSIKLTVAQMIDVIALLKPRYYSIASSQKAVGANRLQLCIGVVEWFTMGKERRFGSLTGNLPLCNLSEKPMFLNAAIKPTCFNLPPTDKHPMLVAGMGTGLAPFRSFMQYRAWLRKQGKETGPLSVYFGCRYSKKDYLYQAEMEALKAEGVITEYEVAFSRDQAEKDYIQHHIVRNGANFYQRMVDEDGYFYLCGSAKQVPLDIRNAVRTVLMEHGGMTEEKAELTIVDWQLKGKYNVEAW